MRGTVALICLVALVTFTSSMSDTEIHFRFGNLIKEVAALKKVVTYKSSYCNLLKKNYCGRCTCIDDYRREEKYFCDCQNLPIQRDCTDFYKLGYRINGIYQVTLNDYFGRKFQVFCDQTTDGGGWTVFQRRTDGSINFYRNWHEYKVGFGDLRKEFWFGNDNLHKLVDQAHLKGSELRIDLKNFDGKWAYAKYGYFKIGDEYSKYQLHVGSYSGNATDSMSYNNAGKFSTYDQDNDAYAYKCAQNNVGAWWYRSCTNVF